MQKAILKVFIEKKIRPLFTAEIYDDIEKNLEDFHSQLNDPNCFVVKFGQLTFKKSLYHHDEVIYK